MLTAELWAFDQKLSKDLEKEKDQSGGTAWIAVVRNDWIVVANIGNSRCVACNTDNRAIPLSKEHITHQMTYVV